MLGWFEIHAEWDGRRWIAAVGRLTDLRASSRQSIDWLPQTETSSVAGPGPVTSIEEVA